MWTAVLLGSAGCYLLKLAGIAPTVEVGMVVVPLSTLAAWANLFWWKIVSGQQESSHRRLWRDPPAMVTPSSWHRTRSSLFR